MTSVMTSVALGSHLRDNRVTLGTRTVRLKSTTALDTSSCPDAGASETDAVGAWRWAAVPEAPQRPPNFPGMAEGSDPGFCATVGGREGHVAIKVSRGSC